MQGRSGGLGAPAPSDARTNTNTDEPANAPLITPFGSFCPHVSGA